MIISARKAREKWCPFDRGQTSPRDHTQGMCIGPECMMWKYWIPPPGCTTERAQHGIKDEDKRGYCGLSGEY